MKKSSVREFCGVAMGMPIGAVYNNDVNRLLKSIAFGMLGAALCFAFFGMLAVPLLGAWARLHNPNTPLQAGDVVIQPIWLLRTIGLPLAAATFVACFALGWKRFMGVRPTQ